MRLTGLKAASGSDPASVGEAMADREDGLGPARPIEAVPPPAADDPTWERLEDQLGWYDRKSRDNQRRYQWLKLLELAVAAGLPVVAGVGSPVWVTGGLAAVIVVLEGVQHLYQFQEQWITYRSTAEALTRERYLYLARAGPYVGEDRQRQLAERTEGWSHRSTLGGRPATNRPRVLRRVDRARTAVVLETS
jgi:Protein of unknown function (DUF4231)